MPMINIDRKVFEKLVGKKLTTEQLKERIAMLGADLEDINDKEISVEIFPNRPDMLSEQGFARAFSSFIGVKKGLTKYGVKKSGIKVYVDKNTEGIRPYTVCAAVKDLKLDDEKIREIIQIQEKLHLTLCRNRRKIAIGIYPLEHIKDPIYFKAMKPSEIQFQPLDMKREMSAPQILRDHPKGKEYAHLIEKLPMYAVFMDSSNRIMSLTPIINSALTGKVSTTTREVFIETSGFDLETQKICLNILVSALADMGGTIYSTEVIYKNKRIITPDLTSVKISINYKFINKFLGVELSKKQIQGYLLQMGYGIEGDRALIPAYRADIMHQVDLAEDIAIAYGYENFSPVIPKIATIAEESKFEIFKRNIVNLLVGLGFLETNTYHITSINSLSNKMDFNSEFIALANPKSSDYSILRTWMIPSLLEVLSKNKHHEYPQNIFEIGSIFLKGNSETGVVEKERLACLVCHSQADFTRIKQVLDYLLRNIGLSCVIEETEHSSFILGRVGRVTVKGKKIAYIGEIHPKVLSNWALNMPVSALELNISELFELIQ